MKRLFGVVLAMTVLWSCLPGQVQQRVPRPSPGAKVSQAVGLSEIAIAYSRPGVKGREIWGKLVPYATVWRAGANEPTLVTFSDEVTISGKKLPAGTYRFLVLPVKDGDWTLIFNSEIKNWGTVYEAQYDTLKVPVKPMEGPFEEWMSFSFSDLTQTSARVVLSWEKVRVSFVAEFNTLAKIESSVGTWQLLNTAAQFSLNNKLYQEQGMAWVDRSIAMNRDPRNLQTKAQLLAQAGKTVDAIKLGEEAVAMAHAKDPKANTTALEAMIAEWKAKK